MKKLTLILLYPSVLTSILISCAAADTIAVGQTIKDGDTVVSDGGSFKLGFFSPGNSRNRYVGIWYNNIPSFTVVWVANRETPLGSNSSGELRVSQAGLQLFNSNGTGNSTAVWSSNSSGSAGLVAQLLDTGNLVLLDQGSNIWQSFDHPGDTLLPGMRIGVELGTGRERNLTAWTSEDDPAAGSYALFVDPVGYPQLFEAQNLNTSSRYGPWDGVTFIGMPDFGGNTVQFVFNESARYFGYELANNTLVSRVRMDPDGTIKHLNWINRTQSWNEFSTATKDRCATYSLCGPYAACNIFNTPPCSCLDGFVPRRPEEWNLADWSSGCQRSQPLTCVNTSTNPNVRFFRNITVAKLPDTNTSWYNQTMTLSECEARCTSNCSCMGYANSDVRNGGIGCLLWFDDLIDMRADDTTQTLYLRMPPSELTSPATPETGSKNKKQTIIIAVSASLGSSLILALYLAWRKRKRSQKKTLGSVELAAHENIYTNDESNKEDKDLSTYSLSIIAKSTNNFSQNNKLGEGGFGPVYKGVLDDGQEIAVKRLSETSSQGLDEFKNEVRFIAKLQHRNLVKLLGYCIHGNERMLIYEYMANKSLDSIIFDASLSSTLGWPSLFHIIKGIARGLLYLHHDSRLRIIHRDLKASNILLDKDMNPKISDFGLARRFSGYESEANTNRVVGTYGYIPPEYALHGLFSIKSDVYSFGVLVLEIVSGKKNRGYSEEEHSDTLIGHAWRLLDEGKPLELMSPALRDSYVESQVIRCIHIGLLCVQHHVEDRPTMLSVVPMLGNENALPPPKQPAFFAGEEMPGLSSISSGPTVGSVDDITITLLQAR